MADIKDEKTFMICSGELGQTTIPIVHDMIQINCIYIFCKHKAQREQWTKEWSKVKGVFTDITPICEALKQAAQECDQNLVSINFVKKTDLVSRENLDQLDSSFMYTQIVKEILLIIDFEQEHSNEFLMYCREQFIGNTSELKNIDKIEKEYRHHQPIWWYTCQCFLYSMLNRALRLMEVDLIIKMGFFVQDLHNHIAMLHAEQYGGQNQSDLFTVHRGQGLSQTDFDQLKNTEGGLLAFDNFLFTSKNHDVSLKFARRTVATSNLVGVLFILSIDPSISTTPFANVTDTSVYQEEEEILFTMHSIFRIEQVTQIDKGNRLWKVDLTLTSDNDPQLHALSRRMREETRGSTGWFQLGKLMVKLAQYNKAEDLQTILLAQTTDERDKGNIYHQLEWIKYNQAKYTEAITFYENSLQFREKTLTSKHPDVAESYNDITVVYNNMGQYSNTLLYHEKAFEIYQKTLPANHPSLALSYNNIGVVYSKMDEYSKALLYYEKTLETRHKTLAANHPDLATSCNKVAVVYESMKEYSKALSYFERALDITECSLPPNYRSIKNVRQSIERVKGKLYTNV